MTLHKKIAQLTADQALAFLVYLGDAATGRHQAEPKPDDRSPIAYLFDGWLSGVERVDCGNGPRMSDADVTAMNSVLNEAADAIIAIPAQDAADVWRKVVVALTGDDPEPRSHAGKLLATARAALGVMA